MQAETFDRLSKRMGVATSRRGVLKAFVAGVAAAIVGSVRSSSTPKAEALGSSYPTTFLKGIGYAEGWPPPAPGTGMPGYNPSTANGDASGACATDGSGHFEFFASDEARAESAPMWGTTYTLSTGQSVTGRDDVGAMAGMGVDMIRMYDWDARNNHRPFLDHCQQKGIKVLGSVSNFYTKFGYPNSISPTSMQELVRSFGNAAGTDYHPAIVGIIIGNEPSLNEYDQTSPTHTIAVTQAYIQAESAVGFPGRPMIGHPLNFVFYYGNNQAPDWGFWDDLVPALANIKNRLFLAPNSYNDANYLFTNAERLGEGYVPATFKRYNLPILFTEIGQDRTKPNYQAVITGQLTGSMQYAAQNPGQLLGTALFQYADKGWLCPTGGNSCPTEGSFGTFSHSATPLVTVPYTAKDFTHFDFKTSCPSQTVVFDQLTQTASYSTVKAAYTGSSSCGGQGQACCQGNTCNAGLTCTAGTCTPAQQCGAVNQPCCQGNTCNAGLACTNGTCQPAGSCGALNQPCCQGNTCNGGFVCTSGHCTPNGTCGLPGQACCSGQTPCSVPNTICSNGTCAYCGYEGQLCCAGSTCAQSTIVCLSTGKCANCGLPSLPCCANNHCTAGTCVNGTCTVAPSR